MARRERPGKHARAIMSDVRWSTLSLAARSVWLGLADVGDVVLAVRAPGRDGLTVEDYARYLASDVTTVQGAIDELVQRDVMAPVGVGFRLTSY
ncbi:hypothetical protein J4P41_12960 [Gluconobacter sp. NFX36]|uniref:hypothetical protein n=1 Tax=Gluconobacter sp. NFX36 TaxID=2819535 RepID=UPI003CFA098C